MRKRFYFYPDDFMGGTQEFTRDEKGAYIELMILQCKKGKLSIDDIQRCFKEDFERLWGFLSCKFISDGQGKFYNERLRQELIKEMTGQETEEKKPATERVSTKEEIEKIVANIKSQELWIQNVAMKQSLGVVQVKNFLAEFLNRESVKTEFCARTIADIKDYFVNWLVKNKNNTKNGVVTGKIDTAKEYGEL